MPYPSFLLEKCGGRMEAGSNNYHYYSKSVVEGWRRRAISVIFARKVWYKGGGRVPLYEDQLTKKIQQSTRADQHVSLVSSQLLRSTHVLVVFMSDTTFRFSSFSLIMCTETGACIRSLPSLCHIFCSTMTEMKSPSPSCYCTFRGTTSGAGLVTGDGLYGYICRGSC